MWTLYHDKATCCKLRFPGSTVCMPPTGPEAPSKTPTIMLEDDDNYQIIPLRFDISGLPDGYYVSDLKSEMKSVLTRILLELAEDIDGLSIKNVEQAVVNLANTNNANLIIKKELGEETMYFNVEVVRVEDMDFGPIIVNAIRDNYNDLLNKIQ